MIRPLVHDPLFLKLPSEPAVPEDRQVILDLTDTLLAHRDTCAGMAANMIGARKNIMALFGEKGLLVLVNAEILSGSGPYETEEGCLSLLGGPRKTKRFQRIRVRYQTPAFERREAHFSGWTAQIIQHEMDHIRGILI